MPLSALALAAMSLAWLVPNHYLPWLSAWQDGIALLLLLVAALIHRQPTQLPLIWAAAIAVALASVALQWQSGIILFGGDALMAALYLVAFALAIALGSTLPNAPDRGRVSALEAVAVGVVMAATASVAVALVQWTGAWPLGIHAAELPRGGRPFGNVAQANHLCTLAFLGLCSLGLLRSSARIGAFGHWIAGAFLLGGMVMSGSRTGWVQMGVLTLLVAASTRRAVAGVRLSQALGMLVIFGIGTLVWPAINELLLLAGGRGITQQMDGGARGLLWWSLLDAVSHRPWTGYGWQQVVLAQQESALDHAATLHHFDHSHNLVLDLLLWAGIPVGGLIVALLGWALWRQLRAAKDARVVWLMAGVGGVLAHAMLEFPHEYAYFLLPTGLALGAAQALAPPGGAWRVPVMATRAASAALLLLLVAIGADYLKAEQGHRLMRLESARIGVPGVTTPPPELQLLTQLSAFLKFAHTEARPGMTPDELESMRRVSLRFAYPPAMFRYALAAGLNGDPKTAQQTLARLCRMHPQPRCQEAREGWRALQARYPVLAGVAAP